MHWTSEKCLSEERITHPRNSLWQAGFFRYQAHEWTKTLEKFSNIRLRIDFVQEETFRDTNTTTWIGKHVPISVSISSNHVEEPIFLCNSDPHHLVASYNGALENLASQSKAKLENLFLDIKTTIKIKLGNILEKLTQRHNRREHARFDMSQDDCDSVICALTQFLQRQKNQLIDF